MHGAYIFLLTVSCHVMITTRLDMDGGWAQPFITMFLYYLSLYRLLRLVLVIISISCHYDPFTNLLLYIQYDMLSFTVCLYAICGMAIL